MRIRQRLSPLGFVALAGSPDCRPAEEEALFRAETVDGGGTRLPFHRFQESFVGDGNPAQVRNRFAQNKPALESRAVRRFVFAELLGNAFRTAGELVPVISGPPASQFSLRIELAALIIEAVRDFVPDHCTDRTIVEGIIR